MSTLLCGGDALLLQARGCALKGGSVFDLLCLSNRQSGVLVIDDHQVIRRR